ncbi:putative peptidase C14 [Colletotrichum sublineola]|uniref:Putative peptidase C14 n=1 Tax=Colletotrichum sublineola TaxID=1173701 RepID=A0A066WT80_COLSU|nr:putative peptidase C14 [Colletotrichum sublineola]
MISFTIGTWSSWALWIATTVALLLGAYRFVAPFIARLKPSQRNSRADGLNVIYDPSGNNDIVEPQFEIVAVHGLGAHPEHTWEGKAIEKDKPRVHLLRHLLPRAFPEARIVSFSYNSDWLVDAPEKTAQQIGHRLAESLAKHRGQALRLPIIFIGHSFGGIVIKKALCELGRSSSMLEDTCGIIFPGTPHQGSSLSIAASLLGKLTALLGSNTALLLSLQSNHSQLSDLEDEFRRVAAGKQITSFYETKPTFYKGLSIGCIVNRESARGFSKDPISVDTDHAGLNKFSGPDHPGFREIRTVIQKLRAKLLIKQADDVLLEKHYRSENLRIERLSGEELSMDRCYINLAIVQQVQAKTPSQDAWVATEKAPKSSPFSLLARLRVETLADHNQVHLKDLFSQHKRSDGLEVFPRRILIRGRAGVGKTTLCKRMVHDCVNGGMWRDLFDRVLWVPLRNLKERPAPGYNLERLFFDEFFRHGDRPGKLFAEETSKALKDNRTLLILYGWDEVNQIATANSDMSRFLRNELLRQPNIIITSRPSASVPVQDQPIDLELETPT